MPSTEVDSGARKLLEKLVDLRKIRDRSQTDAAVHFKLGANGRQTISAWESGHTIPPRERRPEFITYFCDFLGLGDDQDKVEEYWQIVQVAWHWEPLTEQERQAYCIKQQPPEVVVPPDATPPAPHRSATHVVPEKRRATIHIPRRLIILGILSVISSVFILFMAWTFISRGRPISRPGGKQKVFVSNTPPTCYGGAEEVTVIVPVHATTTTQRFVKSKASHCHDINVKIADLSQPIAIRAVGCTGADQVESTWNTFFPPQVEWTTISQNVKVHSCFYLELGSSSTAAYNVRFYVAY